MTAAGDARRARPARRGETEVLTLRLTCCERTWVGPDRAHCCRRHRGCGHVFDDPGLWDDHRRAGRCLDPLAHRSDADRHGSLDPRTGQPPLTQPPERPLRIGQTGRVTAENPTEDPESTPTVRTRTRNIGIPEERLLAHLERGTLVLDGEPVTDLDTPAPPGTRIQVAGQ